MSLVDVNNEWDPLEEIIVGTAVGARVPVADLGLHCVAFGEYDSLDQIPSGPFPDRVLKETEEDLAVLADELSRLGVTVHRPAPRDLAATLSTPDWQTDGYYDYCPRDLFLAIGQTLVETPMVMRARTLESYAYKALFLSYLRSGTRWIAAPRPRLADEMYDPAAPAGKRLTEAEPAFDAANIVRLGDDLLYLVSDSGNELGWQWLQSALGPAYRVYPCRDLYSSTHIDSTIVPLQQDLVLLNPARVTEANLPAVLRDWEQLICPDLVDTGFVGDRPHCSKWIGMNLLVVRPGLVVVDRRQPDLIRLLERRGIDVLPLQLTHARTLGGGFHCVTLDVRRTAPAA